MGKFIGDGSGLTGTASLRATGTTKGDVGLGNVRNVASYSKSEADSMIVGAQWQGTWASISRGNNTTYTNTNNYFIALTATSTQSRTTSNSIRIAVDGLTCFSILVGGSGTKSITAFAIVPPGSTYRISSNTGIATARILQ